MKKTMTAAVIAAAAALALSACSGGSSNEPTATPEPTKNTIPTLKVPVTASGSNASLIVNGGNLPKGTEATIYAYTEGWDASKIDCTDAKAETRTLTITGDSSDQTIPFPVTPGVVAWVMTAGNFSTPCNVENARTTVKVTGNLDILTDKEPSALGAERRVTVWAKGKPETLPVTADVTILGPWATVPEATAADCKSASVAAGAKVQIKPTAGGNVSDQFSTSIKPEKPGAYQVVASVPETDQSTAADTCADGAHKTIFVVSAK